MRPEVTYILSLPHSGSTFLQYCLATESKTLGLGEVEQLSRATGWTDLSLPCSCDQNLENCKLWKNLKPLASESTVDWYERVANHLLSNYPQHLHWVDSSKTWNGIQPWLKLHEKGLIQGLRVIFLVRDARGWALSDQNTRKRKKRPKRSLHASLKEWYKNHKKLLYFLSTTKIDYQIISYERLVFQNKLVLNRLYDFLALEVHKNNGQISEPVVHDIFGNRMKNNLVSRSTIHYDDSWLYSKGINLLSIILFPLWSLNRKLHDLGM